MRFHALMLRKLLCALAMLACLLVLWPAPLSAMDGDVPAERLSEDELAAGEEPALPMDPLAFWEAKAAAGGVVGDELAGMARALTGEHLRWLQNSLEAWCTSHGGQEYPQHINQLLLEPGQLTLPSFYANPYTSDSIDTRDALELPWGWTAAHPGNFSYLQLYGEGGTVRGYVLLGWGPSPVSGMDLTGDGAPDGIVSMLVTSLDELPKNSWIFLSGGREVELNLFGD